MPPPAARDTGSVDDVPDDRPLVVMVARLAPPKDPVTFVRAAALVPQARDLRSGHGVVEERGDVRSAQGDRVGVLFEPGRAMVFDKITGARIR